MRYLSIDIETTGLNKDFCDMIEFGAVLEDTNNQKSYEQTPKFHRYLKPPREGGYQGELFALNMHGKSGIISEMTRIETLQNDMRSGRWQQKLAEEAKTECIERRGLPDLCDVAGIPRGLKDREDAQKLIAPRRLLNEFTMFLIENGYENIGEERGQPKVNLGRVTVAGKNFFAFDWNFIQPLFGERICRRSIDPSIWYWNPAVDERVPSTPECLERAGLEATGVHTSLGDAWDVVRLIRKAVNFGAFVPSEPL